jgi:preprotein translocase subunit YajC
VITSILLASSPLGSLVGFLPMIAIFGIFYFLLFLPMQRQKKETAKMLENLKKGDIVITSGGMVGTIAEINKDDDTLVVKVKPDNVRIQLARNAVSSVRKPEVAS